MRIAVIDYELCDPAKCGGFACINICPVNRADKECITKKEMMIADKLVPRPVISEQLCIGCGLCIKKCPVSAIAIVNTPEQLKEKPVHRFGQNQFALFRLPVPFRGVVGLLGPNGVGKSTALKILAGQLKPNLGEYNAGSHDGQWDEIIRTHRGTELQGYIEKLARGNIRAVYKPQQVDMIPRVAHGKVSDYLKHATKETYDELVADLELRNILDRNMSQLSGGELQRVAIAAAVSKPADLYLLDEPSSYLDVHQRMNMAKVVRKLGERASVMVVEHDLATLDVLADRIHIFYGTPGVFGVVSKPYSTLNGVNAFLDGYIKEDNVRIRQHTTFDHGFAPSARHQKVLVNFDTITKKIGSFSLSVETGSLYREEMLGIFGANGLGKTTLAKILAGQLKADSGLLSRQISISYKPQYISSDFTGSVAELIDTVTNSYSQEFKQELAEPLSIVGLYEKSVKHLSGGELQRVAIAMCLARKADLYLLDEPSAYLDVDQRLIVAKAIKSRAALASAAVIDHDLLFLSYLADRALLFTGQPGIHGEAKFCAVEDGFNAFLKSVGVTFRQDAETKRPRANKPDSQKDREQKTAGKYFMR